VVFGTAEPFRRWVLGWCAETFTVKTVAVTIKPPAHKYRVSIFKAYIEEAQLYYLTVGLPFKNFDTETIEAVIAFGYVLCGLEDEKRV
jgi:hypothetical protein